MINVIITVYKSIVHKDWWDMTIWDPNISLRSRGSFSFWDRHIRIKISASSFLGYKGVWVLIFLTFFTATLSSSKTNIYWMSRMCKILVMIIILKGQSPLEKQQKQLGNISFLTSQTWFCLYIHCEYLLW